MKNVLHKASHWAAGPLALLMAIGALFHLDAAVIAAEEPPPRGALVIAGGGVLNSNSEIYETFIRLGGGKEKIRIAVIPAAGNTPAASGSEMAELFSRYGVPRDRIKVFPFAWLDDPGTPETDESLWRKNGLDTELAKEIRGYSAVFFTGGDQMRLKKVFQNADGTDGAVLAAIREIHITGGVVGGTSAGAAIMSNPMFLGGDPRLTLANGVLYEETPADREPAGKAWLTSGFGFFTHGVIDQHFLKRGRAARLIPVLFHLKQAGRLVPGFGIDENTALAVQDNTITVIGESAVLMLDVSNASLIQTPEGPRARNVRLHYLESGDSYHPPTGAFSVSPARASAPIQKGKEYYETAFPEMDILRKDGFRDMIVMNLADNLQEKAEGYFFNLSPDGSGGGFRMFFYETPETRKFYAEINGRDTYTVFSIGLDYQPASIRVSTGPFPEMTAK